MNPFLEVDRRPAQTWTIWKYSFVIADEFALSMPRGARLLSVQMQFGEPHIWALVNPNSPLRPRMFALRGTGHACTSLSDAAFVGTFQKGSFVGHLFDLGEGQPHAG